MDDEQRLVDEASRGERGAVQSLLERHLPGLRSFVRVRAGRLVRAKESHSDLVQSVCRDFLEHMDRFRYHGEAGFRHWLYTTALRKIMDKHRFYVADKRNAAMEAFPPEQSGSEDSRLLECYGNFCTPSRDAAVAEELARIENAFDGLAEDYREVIALHRIVGMTYAQIAEKLGKTEKQVRGLLARALAQLSEGLRGNERIGWHVGQELRDTPPPSSTGDLQRLLARNRPSRLRAVKSRSR